MPDSASRFIPVYAPSLRGNEKAYVNDCLDSTWISSKGKYISLFENAFGKYTGSTYAASVCNGTAAVHVSLLALGLGPGDEVIVPTLTYIASVNPIRYVGATPIFVDSERDSWQLAAADVQRRITSRTRAILVSHIYGCPAHMEAILAIARAHDLFVIEDCAEAIGSRIGGRHVGTFGDIAAFSFFGNKTITTGEGGMVVTNDPELHDRIMRFKGQGLAMHRTYWHDVIGYNFRMTNICAAIGLAQLERIDEIMTRKLALADYYREALKELPVEFHVSPRADHMHSYWMNSILVPEEMRDGLISALAVRGIETRPVFYPVHSMPMYAERYERHKNAELIARRGLNLPSGPDLDAAARRQVAAAVQEAVAELAVGASRD